MTYLEWNKIISKHFFNPENAGKDVLLYSTKNDIISLGRIHLDSLTDEEIWFDFIDAIKFDYKQHKEINLAQSPIEKPIRLFESWDREDTPPFIAFLILYTIPLTSLMTYLFILQTIMEE